MTTYFVHPDRYSRSKVVLRKLGVIIHTSESGVDSLPALLRLVASPGNRPVEGSNPPRMYGSSYNAFANHEGKYLDILGPDCGPFAAPPCNKDRLHICMPGWSRWVRTDWLAPKQMAQITGVAQFIVDKSRLHGFPTVKITPAQLEAGAKGYCSHSDVTYGFHISGGHTDPGPNFPWDVLDAEVNRILNEGNDMAKLYNITDAGVADVGLWTVNGKVASWVQSPAERDWLIAQGLATRAPTGLPYTMDRAFAKYLTLVGPVPPGSKTKPEDFQTVVS